MSRWKYYERKIVQKLKALDIEASRVAGSGSFTTGILECDIRIDPANHDFRGEVKMRRGKQGFKMVDDWLGKQDFLFMIEPGSDPLVAMRFALFAELLKVYLDKRGAS